MAPEDVERLDDETFCDLAAHAYFFEDRAALAVKRGVIMAIQEVFK